MSPEPEEVIIIMPVSQPLPQTFDPALSLSCMAVPSLWAALGHSWTRDTLSIYLPQVAADFSSCAVLALGSVSVLYSPNARLLRTSGIFQRIQVTLDGATEQVLCQCSVMYPWDPGQPFILFSESCLPFGCHVYRMWSLPSWPRLTGWGMDPWVSVGQTSSLSWKIEMKIQRCHPFPVVARIKDIGALDLCCLVSATKHWSFEMWLVQIEIFCKCKLHIRFQRLDMKKKWDYLIKNFYIDHMLNCILNILMKAIFKK